MTVWRPWIAWCRILRAVEARGCPRRLHWVDLAVRWVLGLPSRASDAAVAWAACLDRRSPDDLAAALLGVYSRLCAERAR